MNEEEKLEIEDIKDPDIEEELDIDKAVSEETPEEVGETIEKVEESEPEEKEAVLEESEEAEEKLLRTEPIKPQKQSKKGWIKYAVIGITVALVGVAATFGYMYYLQQKNEKKEVADTDIEEQSAAEPEATEEATQPTEEFLYINSEVGLNLREAPNTKAAALAIIPFGTKITVIEKQTGWVKTTYDSKTGWVSVDFTQAADPLIYTNNTYGFGLTFNARWAGYKFIEYNHSGSTTAATYYVCLPTTDKAWDETSSGIPKGYASLFVMGVYTKAEWTKLAGGEMLPAKLGESEKYVYTYLPGQAYATDLKTQYGEVSTIIKSFEVLN